MGTDVQVEKIISLPVINPATGRKSRTFTFAGKVDRTESTQALALLTKQVDWKGCSNPQQAIATMGMSYQAELYALANPDVTEIEFRFLQRPQLKFSAKKYLDDSDTYEQACYENMKQDGRMVAHCVTLSDGATKAARQHLWNCGQRIIDCRYNRTWLQSGTACWQWHKPCQFLSVCEAKKLGGDWRGLAFDIFIANDPHPELGPEFAADFGVLTYSSTSTLTLCEFKYYLQCELGLRKRDSQHDEPPWTGSAIHAGLEGFAHGGRMEANEAIDFWADKNPIMGGDAGQKTRGEIAKARGMVRAAAERWNVRQSPKDVRGTIELETVAGPLSERGKPS